MQMTRAQAEAEIAELTSDSELLREWTNERLIRPPRLDRKTFLHAILCLVYIQAALYSTKNVSTVKLAQDAKTQEKHIKEVFKLNFDPCTNSTDPASSYRAIHAALEAMKMYGVEYLLVAASVNYANSKNGERHNQFAKIDVQDALKLKFKQRRLGKLYNGVLDLCIRIIRAYFASDTSFTKTKAAIQECSGQDTNIINYFVKIASIIWILTWIWLGR